MSERVTIQRDTFDEVVLVMSQRQQVMFSDDELIPDDDVVSALQRLRSDVNESDNLNDEIDRLREERRWVSIEERLPDKEIPSERRTDDATLIAAVRILSRTIQTDDGVIPACLAEAAARLETLVEERRLVIVHLERMQANLDRIWALLPPGTETKEASDVPVQK